MKIIVSLIFVLITSTIMAQQSAIDSLAERLNTVSNKERVDVLVKYAGLHYSVNPDKGFIYAKEALKLTDELNYEAAKSRIYNSFAILYMAKSNFDSSLIYLEKAQKYDKKFIDSTQACKTYMNFGSCYNAIGKYPDALENYKSADQYAKHSSMNERINLSISRGVIYLNLSDYDNALKYFMQHIDYIDKQKDKRDFFHVYKMIGAVYNETGQYEKVLNYYFRVLQFAVEYNNNREIVTTNNLIGIFYKKKEMTDSAIVFLNAAIKGANEIGYLKVADAANSNLGNIYTSIKNYPKALEHFKAAFEISEKTGWLRGAMINLANIGNLYLMSENYEMALEYLLKSKSYGDRVKSMRIERQLYQYIYEAYAGLGKYKEAYEMQLLQKAIVDTLYEENKQKEFTNMQVKYETEKKEQENKSLKQQAETDNKLIHRQRTINYGTVVIGILIAILAFVMYRGRQKQKENNRHLADRNEEINAQSEELKSINEKLIELDAFKQNMTGMIVHDLKNPLNGIMNVSDKIPLESQVVRNKNTASQMLNLVLNILDVQKFEDTKVTIDAKPCNLSEITNNAIEKTIFLSDEKNINIENNIDTGINVEADAILIERVFVNLLSNAIKFSPENEFITIETKKNESRYKVLVTDKGSGILKNTEDKIFDKFSQATAIDSGRVRSTGLGLTFCKYAIEAHNCKIGVESELDKGSTFWFELIAADNYKATVKTDNANSKVIDNNL